MAFDLKAFQRTTYQPREGVILLPDLAVYFAEGEKPEFRVRGLDSVELAEAAEAASRDKMLSDVVTKISGGDRQRVDALLEGIGISDDVPAALKKRLEHVHKGCIEPRLEMPDVVKLAECHPMEFSQLANEIMSLTGQGKIAQVKPKPSGQTPT